MATRDEELCPINPHPCPFGPKIDSLCRKIDAIKEELHDVKDEQMIMHKKLFGNGEGGLFQAVSMNSATCKAGIKIFWLLLGVAITGSFATVAGVVIWAISKGALA